jgi:hypothetical protein
MTANLGYIRAMANEASARSVPGSMTIELARLAREVVEELAELRDRMDRHHAYLSGLSGGEPCLICKHEGVPA